MIARYQYEEVAEMSGCTKLQKTVETPMPDAETEENTMTLYDCPGFFVKVYKVGDNGWTVTLYNGQKKPVDRMDGYVETEEEAHEKAQETVESNL